MPEIDYGDELNKLLGRIFFKTDTVTDLLPNLLKFHYTDPQLQKQIHEALILWLTLDPNSSGFLADKIWGTFEASYTGQKEIVNNQVTKFRAKLSSLQEETKNPYVRVVCLFELMPTEIIRKWLWFYNVDFQSRESFLRRLTKEQMESLFEHWKLFSEDKIKQNDLPCFTEGLVNKIYKFFNLPHWFAQKLEKKSAFAYRFFGDKGFQLYPNENDDKKADERLAKQFYDGEGFKRTLLTKLGSWLKYSPPASEERGEFVVNKESGLYWYLYKTMRSNELYRKYKTIELGSYICPGVWATYATWFYLLIVSPLAFTLSLLQLAFDGSVSVLMLSIGTISPLIFGVHALKKFVTNDDSTDYVNIASYVVLFLIGAGSINFVMDAIGKFILPRLILLASLIVLVPYCLDKKTFKFWKMPLFGKALPILFIITLTLNYYSVGEIIDFAGYAFGQLFLGFWIIIFKFIIWMQTWWEVIKLFLSSVVLVSLSYGLYCFVQVQFETILERDSKTINGLTFVYKTGLFSLFIISFLFASGFFATGKIEFGVSENVDLILFSLPFLYFYLLSIAKFDVDQSKVNIVINNLSGTLNRREYKWRKDLLSRITNNNFFAGNIKENKALIDEIVYKLYYARSKYVWFWTCHALALVNSQKEVENVLKFVIDFEEYMHLPVDINPSIMSLLLKGKLNVKDVSNILVQEAQNKREKLERLELIWSQTKKVVVFKQILLVFNLISSFFSGFIKILSDIFHFLFGLYKFCPKSPNQESKMIQ